MPRTPLAFLLTLVGCVALGPAGASAEEVAPVEESASSSPVEAARALAYQGQEAFQAGRYEEAVQAAEAAQRLVPAPTLALLEARALKKLGRYLAARTQYRIAAAPLGPRASDAFQRARQAAVGELLILEDELPRLAIELRHAKTTASDAVVTVDGIGWPAPSLGIWVPQDPGEHVIEVELHGMTERRVVQLAPRARERVLVGAPAARVAPSTESESSTLRTPLAISAFGLSAVGLGLGIGFGVHASDLRAELDERCANGLCPNDSADTLGDYRTARDVSTASYVVSAVSAIAGGVVLLTLPATNQESSGTTLALGPGRLDLAGRF